MFSVWFIVNYVNLCGQFVFSQRTSPTKNIFVIKYYYLLGLFGRPAVSVSGVEPINYKNWYLLLNLNDVVPTKRLNPQQSYLSPSAGFEASIWSPVVGSLFLISHTWSKSLPFWLVLLVSFSTHKGTLLLGVLE